MEFDANLIACARIVEQGDPDRFLAAMAAPVQARRVLFPLYAFGVEIARAPWVTQEPMIAEMRLQWWRDALEEIASGAPARRHEVVTPLAELLTPDMARELDKTIARRRWDIYREPFADSADFDSYIHATTALPMRVAATLLGAGPEAPINDIGYASGIANWLVATAELAARGRVPLLDGRPEAVRALASDALDRLALARQRRFAISPSARPAVLAAWQAQPLLKLARAHPDRVADGTVRLPSLRKRARLAWVAAIGRW